MHISPPVAPDELRQPEHSRSGFAWPPPDDQQLTEDLDEPLEWAGSSATDAQPLDPVAPANVSALQDRPAETAATGAAPAARRELPRAARFTIAALAVLAVAEALLIVFGPSLRERLLSTPSVSGATTASDAVVGAPSGPSRDASVEDPPQISNLLGSNPAGESRITTAAATELRIRTDQPGAKVYIDGRPRGSAPLAIKALAPGRHRVRVVAGKRSVEETVVVDAGATTSLFVEMAAAMPTAGWVDVVAPFNLEIFEAGQLVGTSAQRRLQFAAGEHRFVLVNDTLGYRSLESVQVLPGEVTKLQPAVPLGVLSVNALPWAEVWIDGRAAGTTPLGSIKLPIGTHEIRLRHPELGEQTRHVVVTIREPARVGVEFER